MNFTTVFRFLESDLGKIYLAVPWGSIVESSKIKEKRSSSKMLFGYRDRVGLMLLKHYACCSDKKLIEQLNGNIDY